MVTRIVLFLIINFAGLALGSLFTSNGVNSDWYTGLNKAPWTPPGWVFGVAWSTIMVCFAFYMAFAWESGMDRSGLITLFTLQWLFNVAWNPVFFKYHQSFAGLLIIAGLTILIGYLLFNHLGLLKSRSLLLLPYFIWLVLATSLNLFIILKN